MPDLSQLMIYALGFIGLAAITLIPLRSWQFFRPTAARPVWRSSVAGKMLCVTCGVLFGIALGIEFQLVSRLFQCLTGAYCGPNVASGWLMLVYLGAVYLALETALFILSVAARHAIRRAA